jgi:glycosyltransferase involved in cell wall biosynthesis
MTYYKLDENVKYIPEKRISETKKIRRFIQLFQIRHIINQEKPNVIISFLSVPNMLSVIATRFLRIPVIVCERGDPYQQKGFSAYFNKCLLNLAEGVVFQTEGAKTFYPKKIQAKSAVIPNPVTISDCEIMPYERRKNEIAFVGRFEMRQKRQDIMIKAFQKVLLKYPNFKLVFYGDGEDEKKVAKMVEDAKITKNVIFAGVTQNIQEALNKSKIFILTSDYEGIPNALIEAMVTATPVISTDCSPGGARMLIKNGINGLLVPVKDVEGIAKAIFRYIENPELAKKYAMNATNIKIDYSSEKIISKWEEYIREICRRKL